MKKLLQFIPALTDEQIEKLKVVINQQLADAENSLIMLQKHCKKSSNDGFQSSDILDVVANQQEFTQIYTSSNTLSRTLEKKKALKDALSRIQHNAYGKDAETGENIPFEILKLDPTLTILPARFVELQNKAHQNKIAAAENY